MPQTSVTGSNGYGKFTIAADGTWTYLMDNAHDEFVGGQDTPIPSLSPPQAHHPGVDRDHARHQRCRRHHRLQHRRADRNQRCPEHRRRSQRHRRRQPRRTLHATNQRDRQQRLRQFTIAADGTWTYVMDNAHDEFVGQDYTDSSLSPPQTAPQVLTVTMHGTNDAAVITGSSTAG